MVSHVQYVEFPQFNSLGLNMAFDMSVAHSFFKVVKTST